MFALAIYGSYYTFSNDCKINNLVLGYRFLYNILKNEHRGIRSLVTDILVSITKNHYKVKDEFMNEAVVTIKNLIKIIRREDTSLYYRVCYIHIIYIYIYILYINILILLI